MTEQIIQPGPPHGNQPQHGGHDGQVSKKSDIFRPIREHPLAVEIVIAVLLVISIAGVVYWQDFQSKIYVEKAEISAPIISLGPKTPGILEKIYVREGDSVSRGQRLALVDNQTIEAKTSGIIVGVKNMPGGIVTSQDAVVSMIDPSQLCVLGRIQEDKGLKDIHPGQKVVFTVDAFGQKQYQGTVESVGMTSHQSDIVFSISDKRQEKEFEVKALFDSNAYPELKNGMSAKMWIYR
jgi:multidrug resistance efflux pump